MATRSPSHPPLHPLPMYPRNALNRTTSRCHHCRSRHTWRHGKSRTEACPQQRSSHHRRTERGDWRGDTAPGGTTAARPSPAPKPSSTIPFPTSFAVALQETRLARGRPPWHGSPHPPSAPPRPPSALPHPLPAGVPMAPGSNVACALSAPSGGTYVCTERR
ncbi:hypothetical protein I4F81_002508 [Pyropia yezoensis]|uniref:Uncharacterized protein n=1 Tax=Pyropia yezoensis TaxID=2788 RepID=A0ACC3BQB3_PYRYE|nr:hypothetical protein I4F81_002508 [Neopyropia yezoensis]